MGNKLQKRAHRLPLEFLIKREARKQNIPESEVKIKPAIPRPDGRDELILKEIEEIIKGFETK